MKRQLMTGLFAALAFTAVAQSNEWRDPEVNAVNRAPMQAHPINQGENSLIL